MPQAASLAAAIEAELGLDAELVKGGGGIFDVECDGDLLFSKHAEGRFPENREVLDKLVARRDSAK